MNTELLEIMKMDIKRCEESQNSNEGTHRLYQALIAKYNGIFEGFEKDIPTSGKAASGGGEFNYRPELNAIKEKLELLIATDNEKDPLFSFKAMPMVQITNTNENKVDINISFSDVRKEIENMSALPDGEIEEILNKINELEKIVKSSDRKSKKWENAKGIVKWIADKGVDVGIALLPLLLQIK